MALFWISSGFRVGLWSSFPSSKFHLLSILIPTILIVSNSHIPFEPLWAFLFVFWTKLGHLSGFPSVFLGPQVDLPGPLGLYWASLGPLLDLSGPLWPSPGPLLGCLGAFLGCTGLLLELFCKSSGLISSSLESSMLSILHLQSFYNEHQNTETRTAGTHNFVPLFWPSKWFLFLGPKSSLCDDFLEASAWMCGDVQNREQDAKAACWWLLNICLPYVTCANLRTIFKGNRLGVAGGCWPLVYHMLLVQSWKQHTRDNCWWLLNICLPAAACVSL